MKARSIALRPADSRRIVRLLGEYQTLLESVVECHTQPDGTIYGQQNAVIVMDARRKWRQAENAIALLAPVRSTNRSTARASLSDPSTVTARPAKDQAE